MKKILVIGAAGQIGTELVPALRKRYGAENVIAGYHSKMPDNEIVSSGPLEKVNANDPKEVQEIINKYDIDTIFHLAGLLSAACERNPDLAWEVNMIGLKNILDIAREKKLKIFWPSSIGAFGPTTPKMNTPQSTILEPNTMYGVIKAAGELLCNYYFHRYGVDVRSVRYPGIISWKTEPSDGTTEYSIAMFYDGLRKGKYGCFLKKGTVLPMMYIDDAIKATIDIMNAPSEKITIRTSYNLAAISFAPEELYAEIKKHIPGLSVDYKPDFRQKIADSWPKTIDDSFARKDWGWSHGYNLAKMTKEMVGLLRKKLGVH